VKEPWKNDPPTPEYILDSVARGVASPPKGFVERPWESDPVAGDEQVGLGKRSSGATARDVAKQIASRLVIGSTEGIAGAPAHISNLLAQGLNYLAPNLSDPERQAEQDKVRELAAKQSGGGIYSSVGLADASARNTRSIRGKPNAISAR